MELITMKTVRSVVLAAVFAAVAAQAGQTITLNYVIGTPVFNPASGTFTTNNDDINTSSVGTSGQTITSGQTLSNVTLLSLSFVTTATTTASPITVSSTSLFTLNASGPLTVTAPNTGNLVWTFSDAANHNFTSTVSAPLNFTYSDGTRLTITPIATSFTQANSSTVIRTLSGNITYSAPEPGTYLTLSAGLIALALYRRRK